MCVVATVAYRVEMMTTLKMKGSWTVLALI